MNRPSWKGLHEVEIYTHWYSILKDLKIAFSQLLAICTRQTSLLWHSFLIILYTFDQQQGTVPSSLQSIHEQLHSIYFTDVRWILLLSWSKHLSSKTGLFPQTSAECLSRPKAVTRKRTKLFHKSFRYSDILSYYNAKYTIYDTLPRSCTALPGLVVSLVQLRNQDLFKSSPDHPINIDCAAKMSRLGLGIRQCTWPKYCLGLGKHTIGEWPMYIERNVGRALKRFVKKNKTLKS